MMLTDAIEDEGYSVQGCIHHPEDNKGLFKDRPHTSFPISVRRELWTEGQDLT